MVELVCVDPELVDQFWPHASKLIKAAIDRTGLCEFTDIESQVLSGRQLLWLAWSGSIVAAATTELVKINGHLVCVLTACGGHQRERWLPLLAKIEQFAKDEGCSCLRIFGRRGWERVLNDYRVEHIILEKQL